LSSNLKLFAKRLKQLREERGFSQEKLAEFIDCPISLISYYERQLKSPGFKNLVKLCKLFNESPDYLMGFTDLRRIKKIAKSKMPL